MYFDELRDNHEQALLRIRRNESTQINRLEAEKVKDKGESIEYYEDEGHREGNWKRSLERDIEIGIKIYNKRIGRARERCEKKRSHEKEKYFSQVLEELLRRVDGGHSLLVNGRQQDSMMLKHDEVNSYAMYDGDGGKFYIFLPLREDNEGLALNLETKSLDILGQESIICGEARLGQNVEKIDYEIDLGSFNGYLTFSLCTERAASQKLIKAVIKKFGELQPEDFDRFRLKHRIVDLSDNNEYLDEWIQWHLGQGNSLIDHINSNFGKI